MLIGADALSQTPVTVYGELRAIMQQGDLSAKVLLDTMKLAGPTIGLGVAARLKGEIIIVNGVSYISYVENGKVVSKQDNSIGAAMLVTSTTKTEQDLLIGGYESIAELEKTLKTYSKSRPFAFVIDAQEGEVSYHVIDWQGSTAHTPGNHKQFAVKGTITGEPVTIIGFYSEEPGVFTPHTSKVHLHVYHPKSGLVGHVDELNVKNLIIQIY